MRDFLGDIGFGNEVYENKGVSTNKEDSEEDKITKEEIEENLEEYIESYAKSHFNAVVDIISQDYGFARVSECLKELKEEAEIANDGALKILLTSYEDNVVSKLVASGAIPESDWPQLKAQKVAEYQAQLPNKKDILDSFDLESDQKISESQVEALINWAPDPCREPELVQAYAEVRAEYQQSLWKDLQSQKQSYEMEQNSLVDKLQREIESQQMPVLDPETQGEMTLDEFMRQFAKPDFSVVSEDRQKQLLTAWQSRLNELWQQWQSQKQSHEMKQNSLADKLQREIESQQMPVLDPETQGEMTLDEFMRQFAKPDFSELAEQTRTKLEAQWQNKIQELWADWQAEVLKYQKGGVDKNKTQLDKAKIAEYQNKLPLAEHVLDLFNLPQDANISMANFDTRIDWPDFPFNDPEILSSLENIKKEYLGKLWEQWLQKVSDYQQEQQSLADKHLGVIEQQALPTLNLLDNAHIGFEEFMKMYHQPDLSKLSPEMREQLDAHWNNKMKELWSQWQRQVSTAQQREENRIIFEQELEQKEAEVREQGLEKNFRKIIQSQKLPNFNPLEKSEIGFEVFVKQYKKPDFSQLSLVRKTKLEEKWVNRLKELWSVWRQRVEEAQKKHKEQTLLAQEREKKQELSQKKEEQRKKALEEQQLAREQMTFNRYFTQALGKFKQKSAELSLSKVDFYSFQKEFLRFFPILREKYQQTPSSQIELKKYWENWSKENNNQKKIAEKKEKLFNQNVQKSLNIFYQKSIKERIEVDSFQNYITLLFKQFPDLKDLVSKSNKYKSLLMHQFQLLKNNNKKINEQKKEKGSFQINADKDKNKHQEKDIRKDKLEVDNNGNITDQQIEKGPEDFDWEGMNIDKKDRFIAEKRWGLMKQNSSLHLSMVLKDHSVLRSFILQTLAILPPNKFDRLKSALSEVNVKTGNKREVVDWFDVFCKSIGLSYLQSLNPESVTNFKTYCQQRLQWRPVENIEDNPSNDLLDKDMDVFMDEEEKINEEIQERIEGGETKEYDLEMEEESLSNQDEILENNYSENILDQEDVSVENLEESETREYDLKIKEDSSSDQDETAENNYSENILDQEDASVEDLEESETREYVLKTEEEKSDLLPNNSEAINYEVDNAGDNHLFIEDYQENQTENFSSYLNKNMYDKENKNSIENFLEPADTDNLFFEKNIEENNVVPSEKEVDISVEKINDYDQETKDTQTDEPDLSYDLSEKENTQAQTSEEYPINEEVEISDKNDSLNDIDQDLLFSEAPFAVSENLNADLENSLESIIEFPVSKTESIDDEEYKVYENNKNFSEENEAREESLTNNDDSSTEEIVEKLVDDVMNNISDEISKANKPLEVEDLVHKEINNDYTVLIEEINQLSLSKKISRIVDQLRNYSLHGDYLAFEALLSQLDLFLRELVLQQLRLQGILKKEKIPLIEIFAAAYFKGKGRVALSQIFRAVENYIYLCYKKHIKLPISVEQKETYLSFDQAAELFEKTIRDLDKIYNLTKFNSLTI